MAQQQASSYGTIVLPIVGTEYDLSDYDVWPVDDGRVITIALYPKEEDN